MKVITLALIASSIITVACARWSLVIYTALLQVDLQVNDDF